MNLGIVGIAVEWCTSLAAPKLFDDNKTKLEKTNKLCLYGAGHFAVKFWISVN